VLRPLLNIITQQIMLLLKKDHENTLEKAKSHLFNIPDPILDILKWLIICDVIYKHDSLKTHNLVETNELKCMSAT